MLRSQQLLSAANTFLASTVWISTFVFGLYIICFYFVAYFNGNVEQWNQTLPGLYDRTNTGATAGIGLHFLAGGIILILGCLQMLKWVRKNYPVVHRISGRVYIIASLLAAIGGLAFILLKGTIGGIVMNIGFAGYGILMGWAAVATVYHARVGNMDKHRAWGIRLFALAIGSWLYRMDYGFYIGFGGESGHTNDFTGWFDYFMDFWFYIPNLLIAEIIIRRDSLMKRPVIMTLSALLLALAGGLICFASYIFIRDYWGPGIATAF